MAVSSPVRERVDGSTNSTALILETSTAPQVGDLLVGFHSLGKHSIGNMLAPDPADGTWDPVTGATADRGDGLPHIKTWSRPVTMAGKQRITFKTNIFAVQTGVLYVIPDATAVQLGAGRDGVTGNGGGVQDAPSLPLTVSDTLVIGCWTTKGLIDYTTPPPDFTAETEEQYWVNVSTASASRLYTAPVTTGLLGHGSAGASGYFYDYAAVSVGIQTTRTNYVAVPQAVVVRQAFDPQRGKTVDVPQAIVVRQASDAGRLKTVTVPQAEVVRQASAPHVWLGDRRVVGVDQATVVRAAIQHVPFKFRAKPRTKPQPDAGPEARVLVQRWDGKWLEPDLEVDDLKVTYVLSGPCEITGTISVETRRLRDDEDKLILVDWGTHIFVEEDGIIRAMGILTEPEIAGEVYSFKAVGFAAFPKGIEYLGEYVHTDIEVFDIVRHLWDHLQRYDGRNLNVTVKPEGIRSGVKLGTKPKESQNTVQAEDGTWVPESFYSGEKEPFALYPWDKVDIGDLLAKLAKSTPFDFVERSYWADEAHTQVHRHIELGYPRLGRRRHDLRFAQDENIVELVVARGSADYADTGRGYGTGDGSETVIVDVAERDTTRYSRMFSFSDKSEGDKARLARITREELQRHRARWEFKAIVVDMDHKNAKWGEYQLGDDIEIVTELHYLREQRVWHRIVAFTPDFAARTVAIEIKLADMFSYRGEAAQ